MSEKTWKSIERRVAAVLGAVRVPVTGRARGSAPDASHPWLAIEIKHRKEVPAWLLDAVDQARASARGEQLPVAVIHPAGRRITDSLVVIRLGDFADWFGAGPGRVA